MTTFIQYLRVLSYGLLCSWCSLTHAQDTNIPHGGRNISAVIDKFIVSLHGQANAGPIFSNHHLERLPADARTEAAAALAHAKELQAYLIQLAGHLNHPDTKIDDRVTTIQLLLGTKPRLLKAEIVGSGNFGVVDTISLICVAETFSILKECSLKEIEALSKTFSDNSLATIVTPKQLVGALNTEFGTRRNPQAESLYKIFVAAISQTPEDTTGQAVVEAAAPDFFALWFKSQEGGGYSEMYSLESPTKAVFAWDILIAARLEALARLALCYEREVRILNRKPDATALFKNCRACLDDVSWEILRGGGVADKNVDLTGFFYVLSETASHLRDKGSRIRAYSAVRANKLH